MDRIKMCFVLVDGAYFPGHYCTEDDYRDLLLPTVKEKYPCAHIEGFIAQDGLLYDITGYYGDGCPKRSLQGRAPRTAAEEEIARMFASFKA